MLTWEYNLKVAAVNPSLNCFFKTSSLVYHKQIPLSFFLSLSLFNSTSCFKAYISKIFEKFKKNIIKFSILVTNPNPSLQHTLSSLHTDYSIPYSKQCLFHLFGRPVNSSRKKSGTRKALLALDFVLNS